MENLGRTDTHLIHSCFSQYQLNSKTGSVPPWKLSMTSCRSLEQEVTVWFLGDCQRTVLISPQHANNKLTKSPLRWWHRRFQWSWWSFLVGTGSRVICTVHNDSRLIKASSAATLLFSTKLCHHVVVAAVVAENAATHPRNDSKPEVLEKYHTQSEHISVTEVGALS